MQSKDCVLQLDCQLRNSNYSLQIRIKLQSCMLSHTYFQRWQWTEKQEPLSWMHVHIIRGYQLKYTQQMFKVGHKRCSHELTNPLKDAIERLSANSNHYLQMRIKLQPWMLSHATITVNRITGATKLNACAHNTHTAHWCQPKPWGTECAFRGGW